MTLKELIRSVNEDDYTDSQLYKKLLEVKPEYGSSIRIEVKQKDGELVVSNVHVGSLGDMLAARINVTPELQITKTQLLDAILKEMSNEGFTDADADDFWDDMMDLRKAKNIR